MTSEAVRIDSMATGELGELLQELRRIVDENVASTLRWYKQRAALPRFIFRVSGALIIILSASIPLLAALEYPGKDIVLSATAVLIAALTGLNSFYRWEDTWRSRRETEFALTHLLSIWELKIVEAMHLGDPRKAKELLLVATRQLLEDAKAVTGVETEKFFSNIEWPQAEKR